jgi:protein-S-isoprenylcysteine O-methyltransferase Ste14
MGELPFRVAFGLLIIMMGAIRSYYVATLRLGARKRMGRGFVEVLFWLSGVLAFVFTLLYLFTPWLAGFHFPVPDWVRWIGAFLFLIGNLLFWWSHAALGRNWSPTPEIVEEQRLVTSGPYRYVRHPMYALWILDCVGIALLAANWLVGASYLGSAVLLLFRMPVEERMLVREFGGEYREYMSHTGRLIPRWR